MRKSLLMVLASLLLVPWNLPAQEGAAADLGQYLRDLNEEGCDPVMDEVLIEAGRLEIEEGMEIPFRLESSGTYSMVGVCDDSCPDLDLYLLDANGDDIDEDTEDDAYPLIEFDYNGSGGDFVLEVFMVDCTEPSCAFAVGVFKGTC